MDGTNSTYSLELNYNTLAEHWTLTISDINTGDVILSRLPLYFGVYPSANILHQFAYLRIGSMYLVNAAGSTADQPTDTTLGSDFVLIWSDTE